MDTRLIERWGLRLPVIQAPMGGGPTTPELVAAVCEGGGLGSVAASYLSAEQIGREIAAVRALTGRPFAVNLFSRDADQPLAGDVAAVAAWLGRQHERLGVPPPPAEPPPRPQEDLDAQLDAILAHPVPIVSFTFGLLPEGRVRQMKERGIDLVGTATTVAEAVALERAGCDAVVAQGSEAGAHRGTFLGPFVSAMIGTVALVPQVTDAVKIPVIASGGVMDGRGIVAALALGAAAVQMGTAFLLCDEAGTSSAYREALLATAEAEAGADATVVTDAFSGRAARGLSNRYVEEFAAAGLEPLSYPWQNAFTRGLRRGAATRGDAGMLSLWAGQGLRLARRCGARELMARLEAEMERARAAVR